MKKLVLLYLFVFSFSISAQMNELEIMPHHINYMNNFEKNKLITLANNSNNEITIDSVKYDISMLYLRNNGFVEFPLKLSPKTSYTIEVVLQNYFVATNDTSSVITIFNNSNNSIITINVDIEFKMGHKMHATIQGNVFDNNAAIAGAKVLFFFDGIYLIDSTFTDEGGKFEKELQAGNYFVAVQKEGYYMQYNNLKYSPLDADFVEVGKDNTQPLNFILEAELLTTLSISGTVYDVSNDETLDETVIVVRKGTHTPTKIENISEIDPDRIYSVLTNSKGEYKLNNIQTEGDYYIEAFSQHYLPGYYNHMNQHELFWQNADSIAIVGEKRDLDIYLERDSSYGGGTAKGKIRIQNSDTDSLQNSLLFAISTETNKAYNYNFSKSNGEFNLSNLPSGSYKLVTDKIGFENSESDLFSVTTTQDTVSNIEIIIRPTSVKKISDKAISYELSQNYPNPFNPTTVIKYSISPNIVSGVVDVTLKVYDILGREVATLVNTEQTPGSYSVEFNASKLSSGTYYYRIKAGNFVDIKKMLLLK